MTARALSVAGALLLGLSLRGTARADDPVFAGTGIPSNYSPASADPRVPTPEAALGFRIGDRFATHTDVVAYARAAAAAAPDRVRLEVFGKTPEGRELSCSS